MTPEIRDGIRPSNESMDFSDSEPSDYELAPDGESASPQLQYANHAALLERILNREGTWSGIKSSIVNNRYNVEVEMIPLELRRQLEGVVTEPKPYNSNAQMLLYRGIPLARKTISKSSESERRLVEREIAAGRKLYGIQHIIKLVGTYDSSQRGEVTASILTFPVVPCTLAQFLDDYEVLHQRAELDMEHPRLSLTAKSLLQPSSPEPSRSGYSPPKLEDGTLDRLSALGLLSGKTSTKAQTLQTVEFRLKELMGCLTQAVSWMHARNVGHYDLKPSNILLGSGQLYISDFGHSTTSSSSSTILRGAPGRHLYTAPEIYSSKSAVSLKADIYSLGCIFLNIITVLYGNNSGSRSRAALTWTLSHQPHSLEANINLYIRNKLHLLDDWQINKRRVYVGKQGHHPFTVQMIAPLLAMEPTNRPDAKNINEVLWTSGALERLYHGPCCRRSTVTVQTLVKNVDESPQQVENPKQGVRSSAPLLSNHQMSPRMAEPKHQDFVQAWTAVLSKPATYLSAKGGYKQSEETNRRALSGREKVLGKEYPDTLTSVYNKNQPVLLRTLNCNMADSHNNSPTPNSPPPPPNPAADFGLAIEPGPDDVMLSPLPPILDVFTLPPVSALKLLCAGIEALCRVTGDIPPTPPSDVPTTSNMRGMQAEKKNIMRTNSLTDLSKMRDVNMTRDIKERKRPNTPSDDFDRINLQEPITSRKTEQTQPYIIIGKNAEPINMQHSAITRKFYSKKPPPISLEDYLMRLHKFCPMNTGIYLAASIYIHRLAVEERSIAVTRRNCHRLVLGGLRVAMKALEDLSYPHRRFSKVGGVSESELSRLEISFCFLTNFKLKITSEMMQEHASTLKHISACPGLGGVSHELKAPLRSLAIGLLTEEGKSQVTAGA